MFVSWSTEPRPGPNGWPAARKFFGKVVSDPTRWRCVVEWSANIMLTNGPPKPSRSERNRQEGFKRGIADSPLSKGNVGLVGVDVGRDIENVRRGVYGRSGVLHA